MEGEGKKVIVELTKWVKLKLYDTSGSWCAKSVCAIITPGLCMDVLLAPPFLTHNHIVIDHHACTAIDKTTGFDLLNPILPMPPPPPKMRLEEFFQQLKADRKLMV